MSLSFLCASNSGLSVATKILATAAGTAVKMNNPALVTAGMPVIEGIKTAIDGGTDNATMNVVLKEGITALTKNVSSDPVIMAAVEAALSAININVPAGTFPTLDNAAIKDLVDSFCAGLGAA